MSQVITIASDGGCAPNPGPGGYAYAVFRGDAPAAGCELRSPQGEKIRGVGCAEHSTNNAMELTGLVKALEKIRDMLVAQEITPGTIRLHLDSQYTLNAFFDWIPKWKRNDWRKASGDPVLNRELMERLDFLRIDLEGRGVRFVKNWVKGHSGDYANDLVDEMLTRAREGGLSSELAAPAQLGAQLPGTAGERDLEAENLRLREALEPFAWALGAARERLGKMADRNDLTALACRFISCDHLREAAAVLAESETEKKEERHVQAG